MLTFDNRWIRELPGEAAGDRHSRQVFGALWSPVTATPVAAPRLLACSAGMAQQLGLDENTLNAPEWVAALAGNTLLPGMVSYATCYGGHQFGSWSGQLGDGRAIFLGEVLDAAGERCELQLKGAGPTPYSRRADGRPVLRSSLREFLCSEAMHHLGVPTTRALALLSTGEQVVRDMFYDGHPQAEPGAVLCRVAPSFTRFGHFALLAARGETALLQRLVDFTIDRDFTALHVPAAERRARWFAEVCERTARLVVHWMRVGFVHGVMNTDNMSVLGLTLDYGPYGWIDDFDPGWTPNTTDAQGRRYCFARQAQIARWNLERLADALSSLLEPADLQQGIHRYGEVYNDCFAHSFAAKFGLAAWRESDGDLVEAAFALLQQTELDMSLFFRRLAQVDPRAPAIGVLADAAYQPALFALHAAPMTDWLSAWAARVLSDGEGDAVRIKRMNAVNPCYVLRNYLAQQAIERAGQGDMGGVHELLELLQHPYDEQPDKQAFAAKRPDWARQRAGCSMLSCSS